MRPRARSFDHIIEASSSQSDGFLEGKDVTCVVTERVTLYITTKVIQVRIYSGEKEETLPLFKILGKFSPCYSIEDDL